MLADGNNLKADSTSQVQQYFCNNELKKIERSSLAFVTTM